jgi:hypothetical protein
MRRPAALILLVALASMILALAGGAADARAKRKRAKRRVPSHATEVTSEPSSADAPTPPDVVIPRRLLVLGFGGQGAQAARTATLAALRKKPSLTLVPLRPSEAVKIGTNYSPQKTIGLARRLNLTAVLYGEVTHERGKVTATFTLANGEDARIVGEINLEARTIGALRGKIRTQLWPKLSPLIDQSASPGRPEAPETPSEVTPPEGTPPGGRAAETPPETETPEAPEAPPKPPRAGPSGPTRREPAPPKRQPEAPTRVEGQPEGAPEGETPEETPEKPAGGPVEVVPERRPHGPQPPGEEIPPGEREVAAPGTPCSVLELEPAGGVMVRRFNYRDEQRGALRGYTLYRAPFGRIEGTIYPFGGGLCRRLLSGLGLRLAYEQQAPVKATLASNSLSTSGSAYQAELVLRIARGRFTWQPALGYYVRQYSIETGVIPAADYRSVGVRLDGSWRLRHFTFELGVGGRRPLTVGTLEHGDWFPNLSAFTATGRAQIGLAVSDWFDILLGGYAEYNSFNFNIASGEPDPNGVASGAFDLYLQGTLSARFRFGLGHAPP